MVELKPCPFCGGDAEIYSTTTSGLPKYPRAYCYCKKCLSTGASFNDAEQNGRHIFKAIEAWNRRASNE